MDHTYQKVLEVIEVFREIDPEMQLQTVAVFLEAANSQGITMKEIGDLVKISQSSCSRNVAALSKWHRLNKRGYDLLYAAEDPAERRRKVIYLTDRGEKVAKSVRAIIS